MSSSLEVAKAARREFRWTRDSRRMARAEERSGRWPMAAADSYQPPEKYPGYRRENLGNLKGALQAIYDDLKK